MKYLAILFCLTASLAAAVARATDQPKLELKDGDRVAFIGDTFVEREAKDCYIETMLTSRFPDRNVTFRNLGYSADTVTGSARGLCAGWSTFEGPDKAFERLRKLVAEFKPTVLLMNYGMTESFSGPEGIPTFTANYNKMLDELSKAAGTSPRIVLMSPNYHEDLGKPLPDPAEHNKNLKLYSNAIEAIAGARNCTYINLFLITQGAAKYPVTKVPLTSNGIHLTPYGYWRTALEIEREIAPVGRAWNISFDANAQITQSDGTRVSSVKSSPNGIEFTATDLVLQSAPLPKDSPKPASDALAATTDGVLTVKGLAQSSYELKENGKPVAKATAAEWAKGVAIPLRSSREQAEALRKAIIAKNFDFFNYQRPDNDAYILAFRKGEQGKNAVEIPKFLPLVAEKEKEIAELRVPKPVKYSLELVK